MSQIQAENFFKIMLLGSKAVGKTALVEQFSHGKFNDEYELSFDVESTSKVIEYNGITHLLQLLEATNESISEQRYENNSKNIDVCFLI